MSRAPVKRELTGEPNVSQPAAKKYRYERQQMERRFKKRKLQEVIDEMCLRVENNDRQLTNNLIRELDSEHVRVISDVDFEISCRKMIKACLEAKIEAVSNKIFQCLMGMFARGTPRRRREFVISLQNPLESSGIIEEKSVIDALFAKQNLDSGILSVYKMVLEEEILEPEEVPEKIKMCARRCLAQSSLSSTSCRTIALEFHVALAISTFSPKKSIKNMGKSEKSEKSIKTTQEDNPTECEQILCKFALDRDVRVRRAAAEGLLALSEVLNLSNSTYQVAKNFMKDLEPTVRITAIKLLIYYANRLKSQILTSKKGKLAEKTYSDDAFSEICDSMNDIELSVRVEAARVLGDFQTVSEDLLFQTLDKKMMRSTSNAQVIKVEQSLFALSKKSNSNVSRRWKFAKKEGKPAPEARGGWSRGKELHAPCPDEKAKEEEKKEEEEESIIPHGACGAFVSALEDEFMDVRKAAVYSIGRLAYSRPAFAVSALEYLADMFNDEIADVRLDAIKALTPLISHGQMNAEQLNVISKCLDDAMPEARQAMRELLKRAQFVDINCIEMCIKALLACLNRFPRDKDQIFGCLAEIGHNHAVQVQSIMRNLLDIHLVFQTREPSIEDQQYVGKLILVLNAASKQQSMVHFMPEFVYRHYRFLRNSFPDLIRAIRVIDEQRQSGKVRKFDEKSNEKAEDVVVKTYKRLCDVSSTNLLMDRNLKRDDIFRDTSAISHYNSSVSGAARLIYCLGEVSSTVDTASNTVLFGGELTNVKQAINQSIDDMQSIEHQFSGISPQIQSYLIYCKLYLSFLEMLVWMLQVMAPQNEIIKMAQNFLRDARESTSNHRDLSSSLLEFLANLEAVFNPPITIPLGNQLIEEKSKIITPTTLMEILNRFIPKLPSKFPPVSSIHLKYARITSPDKDAAVEDALRFLALLPYGIPLEFDLYNLQPNELDSVRVKTVHPDGKFDLMKPRKEEIREENGHFSVSTQVKITCSTAWSEAAEVDIVIGVLNGNSTFISFFSSPSCFSPAHVRVKIHPSSR